MNSQIVSKNIKAAIVFVILFCMFAVDLHSGRRDGARQLFAAGIFYAKSNKINGSEPPCKSVMDLLPIRCKSTGKAEPFFNFSSTNNRSVMTYTGKKKKKSINDAKELDTMVSEIKNRHSDSRQNLIKSLNTRSVSSLINSFLIEMDAKNRAYYFILQQGHFNAFEQYCLNRKGGEK